MFGLSMPKWLRRMIRRNTNMVPEERAILFRRKLSYAYAIVAWNTLGLIAYLVYTGRIKKVENQDDLSQARQFAKMLKKENVTMYRIEGITPVGKFNLDEEFAKEAKSAEKQEFTFDEEDISSK